MKRRLLVIGIGAGHPDYITIQAINALNQVDVFFIPDKGMDKQQLLALRRDICDRYITEKSYRIVEFDSPVREKPVETYRQSVTDWHARVEERYEQLFLEELGDGECGAFLVWGDPSLYDSTLRILEAINAKGALTLDYEVIPGITCVQALTARHRVVLNRIGESITITTGRKLAKGFPNNSDAVVVMLDSECAFRTVADENPDIYWGANIGLEDEVLIAGKLLDVMDQIQSTRAAARRKNGWLMDTYLLHKNAGSDDPDT